MKKPLVTIICLCFNHERYIKNCIESIIKQTYSKIEFIIVDNNSEDCSVREIKKYDNICSDRFVNYKFIKNKTNLGIPKALNIALKISKGDFISYISADDIYVPKKTNIQLEAFKLLKKNYAVVCGNIDFIDEYNNKIYLMENRKISYDKEGFETGMELILKDSYFKNLLTNYGDYQTFLRGNYINSASVLIKKNALEEVGLFDESFIIEDWPLWLQISKNYKFYYINKILFHYRKHPLALSSNPGGVLKGWGITSILLREKKYCLKNRYKNIWLEEYAGRIYSFLLNKDFLNFLKFIIIAKSFNLLYFILKKIIAKIKIKFFRDNEI